MKFIRNPFHSKRRLLGFNLVEVTLAVGIVSVTLSVLLALFPVGLQASRETADNSMAASLATDILSTFQANSAGTFVCDMSRFGTVSGATTFTFFYSSGTYTNGASINSTGTFRFNVQNPQFGLAGSLSTPPILLFFSADGQVTSNTGTGTGAGGGLGIGTLTRRPYYRAEITIQNGFTATPYVSGSLSRVIVQMRWPVVANAGTFSGWRPRRGGPGGTGAFTDRSATYMTEIFQIK